MKILFNLKDIVELNEKLMKIDLCQEMMKIDFKSEIEILRNNIINEFERILMKNENYLNREFLKFLYEFIIYLNKSNNFTEFKSKIFNKLKI